MQRRTVATSVVAAFRLTALIAACLTVLSFALARPIFAESSEPLPYGEGLLWRIDTPGSAPSYLFGTIHLTDERVTKLPPAVVKAVDGADSVTLELVMDAQTEQTLAAEVHLTGDRSLEDILGDELYADVLTATRDYGLFDGALRTMKPWVVLMVISVPPEELLRSAMGLQNVDGTLQQMAFDRGTPVHALETVAEQAEALGGMPEADMIAMMRQAVDQRPQLGDMIEEMIDYYLARDLAGLHAVLAEQSAGDDQEVLDRFNDRVIDRRNILMADRMADVLAEGNAFVAVGALHLPGEDGLLSLLVRRGHDVSRIY